MDGVLQVMERGGQQLEGGTTPALQFGGVDGQMNQTPRHGKSGVSN